MSQKGRRTNLKAHLQAAFIGTLVAFSSVAAGSAHDTANELDIDVGGYQLHFLTAGRGSPVVVFENGMGEPLDTWKDVQPAIAKLTATVSYDRGGLGKSQPAPGSAPRTRQELADELHRLLRAARIPGPYILVGHSLGGSVVQVFARAYPDELAGLVLVDPEDSQLTDLLKSKLPPDVWTAREKILSSGHLPVAIKREFDGMTAGKKPAADWVPFPPVPMVLMTGTQKNPNFPGNPTEQDLKLELHNALAARVPGIEHILVPESRHYIQDEAPQKVGQAIVRVLARSRPNAGTSQP
jgi:pimeloyl-ACP methyl ester carboxylesterase